MPGPLIAASDAAIDWNYLRWNSYLSTRHKLLYVATPKVACTSLKWWFAALEGHAQALRGSNGSLETDPDLVIHDTFHKIAPEVTGLSPHALAEALAADDYFTFAVVRNPYKRIFSAWQSKILLREPLQIEAYRGHDFVHHPIRHMDDISVAFEKFLEYLAANESPVFRDAHWTPQAELLRPDLVHYSMIARIEDTKALSEALLTRLGPDMQDPFTSKRSNGSLIPYLPELVSARSGELIRSIYARDFQEFRYAVEAPPASAGFSAAQGEVTIRAIAMLRGKNKRFEEIQTAQESQLSLLGETLDAKETRVVALSKELEERSALTASLNEEIQARQETIARVNLQLAERDKNLGDLRRAVKDGEDRIDALGGMLAEIREELRQLKVERDAQVVTLEKGLVERDATIDELRDLLAKSSVESSKLSMIRDELEDMNSRMRGTVVWRIASKLRLITTAAIRHDSSGRATRAKAPKGFDPAWYLKEYPDVAASGMDPYEHYVLLGKREGRRSAPLSILSSRRSRFRIFRSGLLSAVRQAGGVRKAVEKVVTVAKRDGWFVPDFDEAYYLEMYPDIREAGIDPYEHFVQHGRAEGRIGRSPELKVQKSSVAWDAAKKAVLVVSHEASRTGAPILSLNIARELQKRFNVVVLILGDGPMMTAFCEVAPVVVGPMSLRANVGMASDVITQLTLSYEFEFAIVNSIESRFVLRRLTELSIPAISLIHEFAAYTRPLDAFPFAILWAAETVFSARITHENAVAGNTELAGQPFHIMPQGRCTMLAHAIDAGSDALERSRLLRVLRPGGEVDKDTIVIVGVGYVQYRKGVDLFLECAARVARSEGGERCRFVWIGKGYDPLDDMAYSAYLAEQLQRSGLQQQFAFMGETAAIEQVYESADLLLLSSRLDPLPNVAIDAMAHGLPVVCFANTTGVVDALVDSGLAEACVAPYLDTAAMAELVLKLARSKELRTQVGTRLQQTVREQFDMERYVAGLEGLARNAKSRLANELESTRIILDSALARPDFFLRTHDRFPSHEDMVRYGYVRCWGAGISRRKLLPGFHPGIYAEQHGVEELGLDPLASYLRAGLPEGPWRFEVITPEDAVARIPAELRVALHLHVYYPDLLADMLERLSMNAARPDLFVSVPDEEAAVVVRRMMKPFAKQLVRIEVVPNVGRDLGPMLTAFGSTFIDHYDIVGHLHTKKSVDLAHQDTAKTWSQFLMENLLGGKTCMADRILGRMAADPSIGMVFPDDPNIVGWSANRLHAEELGARLGLADFPENLAFPVGSMFWARSEALRPLFELGLHWQDYPAEPLPYDGSMLHAIERLLPLVAEKQSTRIVLTNVAGKTR